jgi:AbrB family looped-hinge helix DNA binding protein
MTTLSVSAKGEVMLPKDVMEHLGIQPGGKIAIGLLPDGHVELRAAIANSSWEELSGMLKNKTDGTRLTVDEINAATSESAANAGTHGLLDS